MPADNFGEELLKAHNERRAAHGAKPLQWSDEAASKAKVWAEHLANIKALQHGNHDGMGQNLFMQMASGKSPDASGQLVTDQWYAEIKKYSFKDSTFKPGTGHFTQVVWASTTEVGAAKVISGNLCCVVANYNPPGNMMGKFAENVKK